MSAPSRSIKLEKLILASRSPRRAEILNAVGWPFKAVVAGIDETRKPDEDAIDYVRRLALGKASVVAEKVTNGLVMGADTVVVFEDHILGQPKDREDARRMLNLLNGNWHTVITGVALIRIDEVGRRTEVIDNESTKVRFSKLTDEEIEWYISTDEPMDKAGAYAIQGMASLFIEEVQGEYFNVMGLPIRLVYELWQKISS